MNWLPLVVGLVAAQRVAELLVARRNTRRLRALGAIEVGRGHYPLFVLLHGAWLLGLLASVPWDRRPLWPLLGLYLVLQPLRLWVIATLGERWTTRIIVLPGAPLVRKGPYRWLRHPNYVVVALEVPLLALAFRAWLLAVLLGALNVLLLAHRIRVEEQALRQVPEGVGEGLMPSPSKSR